MYPLFRRLCLPLALSTLFAGSGLANASYQYRIFVPGLAISSQGATAYSIDLQSYSFPQGEVGQSYNVSLASLLQVSPVPSSPTYLNQVAWSVVGSLPAGLALTGAPDSPAISGTPSATNNGATFNIVATYLGSNGQQVYTITVGDTTLEVTSIAVGQEYTCAITTFGGAKCWGGNSYGQLGNGTTTDSAAPVNVVGLTAGVSLISAGTHHACAITSSGAAKCWGAGTSGKLGNGSTSNSSTPVDVTGLSSGVSNISAGRYHTCAVNSLGGAQCWGDGNYGKIGNGNNGSSSVPVNVLNLASGVASVSVMGSRSCAVTTSGGAKCWGGGGSGQLGGGVFIGREWFPVDVVGLTSGVVSITTGDVHTCALTTSGGAKCWGGNSYGQLGNGNTTGSATPVDVTGLTSGVSRLVAGGTHSCAITSAGGAKCWGDGGLGRLGNGAISNSSTPVSVTSLSSAVSISANTQHTCVVLASGGAQCWGWGGEAQLGNGSTSNSSVPVSVLSGN